MFNALNWWLAYTQGLVDAYKRRLGVSLRTPALRESVDRRFPERPLDAMSPRVVVGVDMAGGPDRCVCSVVEFPGGRVVDSWEVGGKDG
ncbi:MAG TPA: hypothetical protein PLN91_09695 [Rhodanobacteraceae bacterium]|nr:hypothetical protein [Rhodanobacteraceae bacterium]